jgi:hypothetical protein
MDLNLVINVVWAGPDMYVINPVTVFITSVKSLMDTTLLNSNVYIYTTSCTMLKIIDHGHRIDIDY